MNTLTAAEALIPAVVAIVFVVAWFVFGLVDATRRDPGTRQSRESPRTTDPRLATVTVRAGDRRRRR